MVTGGNSGIGYAAARELKEQGARVFISGRRKEAVDQAAAGLDITGIVADQSSLADIEALAMQVREAAGQVDILFINAGVLGMGSIEEASEAVYDEVMDINLKPRNPMPDTTYATTCTDPSCPVNRFAISTKMAAPTATSTLVRNPAVR